MKTSRCVLLILGIAVMSGALMSVDAQMQDRPNRPERGQEPLDREEILRQFDADGDGELSETERQAARDAVADRMGRGRSSRPGFGGDHRGGPGFRQQNLVPQFDTDGDGKLNDTERAAAREQVQGNMDGRGRFSQTSVEASEAKTTPEEDIRESSEDANPTAGLYDAKVLRTLYLRFPNEDWFQELSDFAKTGVEVPADLIVDGELYPSVGVRFRGGSSMGTPVKKPFNLSIDYGDDTQRLYGYKTLNLLNCNSDPSFVREVVYYQICRQYMPAPKANFVKLIINGENWGVYANVQQFNKDFLQDWFDTKQGVRWKVTAGGGGRRGGGGTGSLVWNGPEVANYESAFQLKTKDAPNAFEDLIKLCEVLSGASDEQLETELKPMLDIDRALWNIALDNVFLDTEGYSGRGGDYLLYQDEHGRFHILFHDSNEGFGGSGGGPSSWPRGAGMKLSPVVGEGDEARPVISRLLAIPHLRARYLAHVRTIAEEWLDWNVLGPIIESHQSLIDAEVKADDKKLYPYEAFASSMNEDYGGGEGSRPRGGFGPPPGDGGRQRGGFGRRGGPGGGGPTPSLKRFAEERREFLLGYSEIAQPTPIIGDISVLDATEPLPTEVVRVKAQIRGDVKLDSVILHYAPGVGLPFEEVPMFDDGGHSDGEAGDGVHVGQIPPFPAGTKVRYYVEARAVDSFGTTTFSPANTEFGALTYRVGIPIAISSPIVINELMASNTESISDPQGNYDDWLELHNVSDQEVVLSGMFLSDNRDNPRKWAFPEGTKIAPGGYLVVWADEDGKDQPGLHANFRLSKNGEIVMLIDRDERGNQMLDSVEFGPQPQDAAIGRFPDGTGDFTSLAITPNQENKPQ